MSREFCVTVRFPAPDGLTTAGAVHTAVSRALLDPSQVGVEPEYLPPEYTIEISPVTHPEGHDPDKEDRSR